MNQLKAGVVLSYVSLVLTNLVGLTYTPFMLRMLGKEEYGLLAMASSAISYLGLLTFGFGNAITRYAVQYKTLGKKEEEHSLYGMFILLYSFVGVLALIAGITLSANADSLFKAAMTEVQISRLRIMLVLLTINTALSFPLSLFAGVLFVYERFVFTRILGIVATVLNPLLMVVLLLLGYRAVAMVVLGLVISVITSLVYAWYAFARLDMRVRFKQMGWGLLREIAGFSFYIFLAMVVDLIYWSSGQLVLGAVAGASVVAIYAVGMTFRTYYFNLSTAISGVFFPKITEMVTRNCSNDEFSELFIRVGRIQFLVIFFVLNGFIVFGQEFIGYWAGPAYAQSYWVALIIMVPVSVPLIQNLGVSILQARNQQAFRSIICAAMALASLAVTIPMARRYGAIGCTLGAAIALVFGNVIAMNLYYHKRVGLNIPAFWRSIGSCAVPIVPLVVLAWALDRYFLTRGVVLLVGKIVAFSALYVWVLWRWCVNDYERSLLQQSLRRVSSIFAIDRQQRKATAVRL